jgi:hypothetical protein
MSKVLANERPKKTASDGAEPNTSPQTDMVDKKIPYCEYY